MNETEKLRQVQLDMATVMVSLLAGPRPAGELYVRLGCEMARWELVQRVAVSAGLVTVSAHLAALSPKGRTLAEQMATALERA